MPNPRDKGTSLWGTFDATNPTECLRTIAHYVEGKQAKRAGL
jgi:hypothetical protein